MTSKLTGVVASGRAIIATALPGTQLFETLEGAGIVTPPGDIDAFVSALLRLVEDLPSRQQLGQEAREYAVSRLSRHEILQQFERVVLDAFSIPSPDTRTRSRAVKETAMAASTIGEDSPAKDVAHLKSTVRV